MMNQSILCGPDMWAGRIIPQKVIERLKQGDKEVLVPACDRIDTGSGMLVIDPQKCNGCKLCEFACSLFHEGEINLARSRIHVLEWNSPGVFLPVLCQQCSDAPCRAACPKEAISWQDDTAQVVIDYDRCVSCGMCVAACPFGAMGFDGIRQMVFKCDVCGGNPQCVHFCEPGALTFPDADDLPVSRLRLSAGIRRRY
jgi:Fe-S-cluster-containing hydrogenase component 2